ncbi:hypothetical protein [Cytobacillus horneckiae]|uniref:hypothetical protein n=1 Tax=Cytobacillus horneckiae TaxID=549687 RepID=UPI003D9A2BAC
MAVTLPHIEDANQTNYLPPKGEFEIFESDEHYFQKLKEWGLPARKEFWFKQKTHQRSVHIIGYEVYGAANDMNTIVIKFQDGNKSCIHPAYLKEMQSGSFGKEAFIAAGEPDVAEVKELVQEKTAKAATAKASAKKPAKKKESPVKIELPTEKVHFSAVVKQMALSWNHFAEDNDEVVVLEDVVIEGEQHVSIGLAWCSHSKTLKKHELAKGERLSFDGKIVKKKLPQGKDVDEEYLLTEPVQYKINNPSKITKS